MVVNWSRRRCHCVCFEIVKIVEIARIELDKLRPWNAIYMYNSRCACARHTVVFGASMGSSRIANSSDPRVGNVVELALISRHVVNCSVLVGFRGGRRGPGCGLTAHWAPVPAQTSRNGLEPGSDARTGPFISLIAAMRGQGRWYAGCLAKKWVVVKQKNHRRSQVARRGGFVDDRRKLGWQGIELSLVPSGKYT